MFTVKESAIIACPVARAFAAAADPHTQLAWDPDTLRSVEQLTPGPLTRGARYRGDFKDVGVVEYEFAEYEPERRFAHHTSMQMGKMRHIFTFERVPEGTRLTQEGHLTPNLLGRLLGPLIMAMMRKRFRVIASELNQYLTSTPTTGVAAPGEAKSAPP